MLAVKTTTGIGERTLRSVWRHEPRISAFGTLVGLRCSERLSCSLLSRDRSSGADSEGEMVQGLDVHYEPIATRRMGNEPSPSES